MKKLNRGKTTFLVTAMIAGVLLAVASAGAAERGAEDMKLDAYFQKYLDNRLQLDPVEATSLGDHRFDSQMTDISAAARANRFAQLRNTLKELPRQVDYAKLSRDGQIDFEIFKHNLEKEVWLHDNEHEFEEDPRTYGGYINDSVYLLLTQSTLPKETNIANCIARMAQIPAIITTAKATLTHPAKPILETAIRQNKGAISFYESEMFELAGQTSQQEQLKAAAAPVVAALKEYQNFLENDLMSRATGEWRLGRAKFTKKLDLELDAGMTADQVYADAQAEFDSVRRDMYVIARQLWPKYYPKVNLPPDDAPGHRETIVKVVDAVDQEHGKAEDLVRDARAAVEKIKTFISERNYLKLPDPDHCKVIEMPEFRRGNSLAYLDNAPPLDPKAESYYAISPPPSDWTPRQVQSFLEEYNSHMLQILTIHEGYPGHYVQLDYANRNPSLIRKVYQSGAYVEGWAVYGEQTMLNEGYGDGDLRLRLMQLKFYLRAVVNALLDNKMHCTQFTDDEAMKLLVDDSFQSEGEAKLKVIRAKQSSTQLSTYFVGRMAHYRLHQQMERELGDKFDLAKYHEAVLTPGSVPVKYLPELVRAQLIPPK